jgi:16S rRNA (cytosine1402-N4)-methyltransferase
MDKRPHTPIMVEEFLKFFADRKIKTFFDGTLGAGGHAAALLEAHPEIELYIGCDRDPTALAIAKERLQPWENKLRCLQGDFADLDCHLTKLNIKQVDGFFLT